MMNKASLPTLVDSCQVHSRETSDESSDIDSCHLSSADKLCMIVEEIKRDSPHRKC